MKKIICKLTSRLYGNREAGMATAEYAVGTVGVIGIGGILWKLITSEPFREALWSLIKWLFGLITGVMG